MVLRKNIVKLLILVLVFTLCTSAVNAENLLQQGDFKKNALPWELFVNNSTYASGSVENGQYVMTINDPGTVGWHIQLRHRGLTIENGHTYNVSFKVTASKDAQVYAKVGMMGDPYEEFWSNNWQPIDLPAGETVTVDQTFTMSSETHSSSEFAFHFGGEYAGEAPYTVAIDDVVLWDDEYTRPDEWEDVELSDIRANQHGYLPDGPKMATLISDSSSALTWQLLDSSGNIVSSGLTQPFGYDDASGDNVHIIDFSNYDEKGQDYTLAVGDSESFPFDICSDIYNQLKYDALAYFYHNRSGIAIEMPYAGGEQWTRPAGHLPDIANPGSIVEGNYTIDATGGWYDAGDHGKYVVNGGISVWTLMNLYERALYSDSASTADFADGSMNIPENDNGYPDLLDEARWEMEMLLKMQVPEGNPKAGMAVHKLHDTQWSALPTAPHEDTMERIFLPPSTAATLNLAAAAAQSARLWEEYDAEFAQECLTAAKTAWDAAQQYPGEYANPYNDTGGGAYSDSNVQDEFYWAAAELFITTAKSEYLNYILSSPYYLAIADPISSGIPVPFGWANTGGLGTISLALVPNDLNTNDVETARNNIINAADQWINIQQNEGYGVPIEDYYWGSNSVILNEAILMAYAHDFTANDKYFHGVVQSMDYILGRNALSQSYITGYGELAATQPHHRFWANAVSADYPKPPAGVIAGGANDGLEDPIISGAGFEDAPPQECYLDHIESYSTNECAINWNSPLAWVSAYLDGMGNNETTDTIPGDLNDSGSIDSMDYVLMRKYILDESTAINLDAADINEDGLIDSLDYIKLRRYIINEISSL